MRGLPLAVDLGSGTLVDMAQWPAQGAHRARHHRRWGRPRHLQRRQAAGGPQAGLIVGRKDLIAKIKKNGRWRAAWGKLTLAALENVLRLYLAPEHLAERLTTLLRLFTRTRAQMQAQAERLLPAVQQAAAPDFDVAVAPMASQIGSARCPSTPCPCRPAAHAARSQARRPPARPAGSRAARPAAPGDRPHRRAVAVADLRCLEAGDEAAFGDQLPALHGSLAADGKR